MYIKKNLNYFSFSQKPRIMVACRKEITIRMKIDGEKTCS